MNIYVGNIPYDTDENALSSLFEEHGEVVSIKLIKDRDTGRPKGFGFIEMDSEGGPKAIDQLNSFEFNGRKLVVNEAKQRNDRNRGFGGDRY